MVWRAAASTLPAEQLVFECGSNIALTPIYTCAPKRERARGSVLRNRGKNTTNLHTPKCAQVRLAIEAKGCQFLFLPGYSPDFSPIEEAQNGILIYGMSFCGEGLNC